MRAISRRELTRRPSVLNTIGPGDVVQITDQQGGLLVTRQKTTRLSAEQMSADLEQLAKYCPKLDLDQVLGDDE